MAHPTGMEQHLGLQFLQLPHSLLLQILWAASLLCLQFHGEGASFCRSPVLSNLEVIRDNHGFWPMLIGSSVSHASSLCCLPHFRCCIPSWLSKLLTHSDFSSPPDAEATACLPLSPPAPTAVQSVIFITNLYFCITHSSSAPLIKPKVLQPFPPGFLITWLPQRNLFLVIGQSHHQSRIGEPLTPFLFPLPQSGVVSGGRS